MKNYEPKVIEPKWVERWAKSGRILADKSSKPKYYALVEFPYPSGFGLHVGHAFTYTLIDVFARQKRMNGYHVMQPMGWDAFGLPTENFAIKSGRQPAQVTKENTQKFKQTDKRLGISFDWDREVDTTDPEYYKWTQWIFIQLFNHDLAYKTETAVGWCPKCKIILANEEIVNGKCERCGTVAEHRMQNQWLLRITKYADRLADELDLVDYPAYVKKSQRDWIGRSFGATIKFPIRNSGVVSQELEVFTTRPDTVFGATFMVISPEHQLVGQILAQAGRDAGSKITPDQLKTIQAYVEQAKTKSELERAELDKEKTGVFTGLYAINPATGKEIPIWISDFVLASYGTGAIMSVPAHDERDFDFAKKFGLEIVPVISPEGEEAKKESLSKLLAGEEPFTEGSGRIINSDNGQGLNWNGLRVPEMKGKIIEQLEKMGLGKAAKSYHLRDWVFSRQHYWGEPIPMIYCASCAQAGKGKRADMPGWYPVPEDQLPVALPQVERYQPTDTGASPLAEIESFVTTTCPACGHQAKRETDTMPNWAGSSWYYLAYCFAHAIKKSKVEGETIFSQNQDKLKYWLPVDVYLGGAEHTTLHLLYSRFWHKFLNDIQVVPGKEPYAARRQHGVILGPDGFRMSKSRGNVVNPEDVMEKWGADTLRLYLMFMGPYDATMAWNEKGVEGAFRFLNRVWRLVAEQEVRTKPQEPDQAKILERMRHTTIKKVTEDLEAMHFNTAIAKIMEYVNALYAAKSQVTKADLETLVVVLAPVVPFMAEELWQGVLGNKTSVHDQVWPEYELRLAQAQELTVVIQVNGKVRGELRVGPDNGSVDQSGLEERAKQDEKVASYLVGQTIKKTIYVPGKLINFVV